MCVCVHACSICICFHAVSNEHYYTLAHKVHIGHFLFGNLRLKNMELFVKRPCFLVKKTEEDLKNSDKRTQRKPPNQL